MTARVVVDDAGQKDHALEAIDVVVDNEYEYGNPYSITKDNDPFLQEAKNIRNLQGVSSAIKRKISRSLNKAAVIIPDSDVGGDAKSKQIYRPVDVNSTGYNIFNVVVPPYNLDYLAQIYEICSPHYAAVNAKTANIVGLGHSWIETGKTEDVLAAAATDEKKLNRVRNKIELAKRAMDEWLDNTNEEQTFTETLMALWVDLESTGNGYLEIGRTSAGDIRYLGHIPSITMRVRTLRDGYVQIVNNTAVFFRRYGDRETPDPLGEDPNPNEVIHFKKYSPTNNYYGVPDIIAAKNALAGLEFADRFNLDYFEHKAVPRYVIVLRGAKLGSDAERKVISFFKTGLKGKNHRTLFIPLPKGDSKDIDFKIEPVEPNVQDASFTSYRNLNIDSILMAHRVAKNKVGLSDNTTVASANDSDKTFKEQVCAPWQSIVEKRINKIFAEKTDALKIKLNELSLTDANVQSQIDQRYLVTQVEVPNEIRKRMGMRGYPGGDQPINLKAQSATDVVSNVAETRTRDQERSSQQADNPATRDSRNPKGEGRSTE